ncbi:hypothetical protein [Planktothrix agardhii]|uniref:hypothetical protein n=1 Tax=Planktothrix agardhii TaxID=1160 RepID=UPI0028AD95BB|nr:hypothetical protein [Planktothrix agardhii]
MKNKLNISIKSMLIIVMSSIALQSNAQDWKSEKKVNVVFGLTQPIFAKGFNIEGNYIHKRLIFGYSHGVSLDLAGTTVTPEMREQGLAVHLPYTTGFGIGYRLKEWVNVRIEPKWHRFEFHYDDETQNSSNQITAYNTMTIGIGVYGHYQPFKNKTSFLKGIMISPSIRFWPTISSTLEGNSYNYLNKNTGKSEEIKTLDVGPGFTPFIYNISIGYSFGLKKK